MIKKLDSKEIDKLAFNWGYRRKATPSVYPPMVWEQGQTYFQLNYFDVDTEACFIVEGDAALALQLSIDFHNAETINMVELAQVYAVSLQFHIPVEALPIFAQKGIKGRKHFEILNQVAVLPDDMKRYISEKEVSLKIVGIYLKLNEKLKTIVSEYIDIENPSVGNFRKFINFLFDYSRVITIDYYDATYFKSFESESLQLKNEFEKSFQELKAGFKDIEIDNHDNFETDTLAIHFTINSPALFKDRLKVLMENEGTVESLYTLMSQYDLH